MRIFVAIVAAWCCVPAAIAQTTSNFSMVGFDLDLEDEESFSRSVENIAQSCDPIKLDEDDTVCLVETGEGGQLWIGLRTIDGVVTLTTANPAFVGKSSFPVIVNGRVSDPEWEPYEYSLSVNFVEEQIPLLIAISDPRDAQRFDKDRQPEPLVLDLTAFTFNPEIYENAEEFTATQVAADSSVVYAENFFIPSGLFGEQPTAHAMFAGKVIEAELTRTDNGATYWRTLVEVLGGGTINVVFDDISTSIEPKPGNLIVGQFWLSARIPPAMPSLSP